MPNHEVNDTTCVIIPESVLAREISGEMVILDLNSERYFGLDTVGASMWEALSTGQNIGQAVVSMSAIYEADMEVLHRDLVELVQKLALYGLVVLK